MGPHLEILIGGSMVAVSCALLGCFLVLRKMSMISDAISHAVLPGIVIAYLLTGGRSPIVMFIGAVLMGLLTTFLIELFHRKEKLQTDASIGITFTTLFAIGIILITRFADKVDLDQDCVLYGDLAMLPLNRWISEGGIDLGPTTFWSGGLVLLVVIAFIILFFKQLKITTFDPVFATAIGMKTLLWHYLLMGAVSMATVTSFEAVGAILVVAFLVVPPITAFLLTRDLVKMLLIASILGVIAACGGYLLAYIFDGSIAGGMAMVCGIEFFLVFLFSPQEGIIIKKLRKSNIDNPFDDGLRGHE